jgi:hypothetical protein
MLYNIAFTTLFDPVYRYGLPRWILHRFVAS